MPDRTIQWDGFYNARDLGGLPTVSGMTTRYGAVVRSADPRFVTATGWQSAFDAGFRTVIDLRNDDEIEPGSDPITTLGAGTFAVPAAKTTAERPSGIGTIQIALDDIDDTTFWHKINGQELNGTPLYYQPFIEAKPERVAAVMTAIARAQPGGIIFHCGGGRDRAGLVSLFLLALAGVTPEAITEDYELSLTQIKPLYAALGIGGHEPSSMLTFLRERGVTLQETISDLLDGLDVDQYLAAAGVSQADIAALRERLL